MAPTSWKKLIPLQRERMLEIKSIRTRLTEKPRDTLTGNIVQSRIDAIDQIWLETRKTHGEIIIKDDAKNDPYVTEREFEDMQVLYEETRDEFLGILLDLQARINDRARLVRNRDEDSVDTQQRPAKLPKLDLPTFSGRFEDWDNFYDLFSSLVHDVPHISDATKLQYLKSCLTGSAADLIKNVTITNANYRSTWQTLRNRFYNPRITVNNHLHALVNLPQLKRGTARELRSFTDEAQLIVRALENLKMPVQHCNFMLVFLIANKLDPDSRMLWESEISAIDQQIIDDNQTHDTDRDPLSRFPKFTDLAKFLEKRARALNVIAAEPRNDSRTVPEVRTTTRVKRVFHALPTRQYESSSSRKCTLCQAPHSIYSCPDFIKLSLTERQKTVRRLKLCFNCLGNHQIIGCSSNGRCLKCRGKHHTLLHQLNQTSTSTNGARSQSSQRANINPEESVAVLTANVARSKRCTILATAQIILINSQGVRTRARALFDQGSEATFVTESMVQLLGASRRSVQVSLSGLGATITGTTRGMTQLTIQSRTQPDFQLTIEAFILSKLTSHLPSRQVTQIELSSFDDLELADPYFHTPDSIDIILGADAYGQLIRSGLKRSHSTNLIAQNTALGWIISGTVSGDAPRRAALKNAPVNALHCVSTDELQRQLQTFWELEESVQCIKKLHPEEERCENLFNETHKRELDGRYTVRLPFKSEPPKVAYETRRLALRSLESLHRRFLKDPRLSSEYREFMSTYERLGHMSRVPSSELNNPQAWYLPHHAVIQSSMDYWKLRVVFDASRRTRSQHSLNQFLLPGPSLQNDLALILLNWRRYRYAFTADIVKMFRQIRVHPYDQDYQRILWAPRAEDSPIEFRLTTVTYGTACAPYLAIRTLKQLAEDQSIQFPLGSRCLIENTYVDDAFCGADELSVAIEKRDQLIRLLTSGGIELDKWAANHSNLLPKTREPINIVKEINSDDSVKTLGVRWNPNTDEFSFCPFDIEAASAASTKRAVLSSIARLFDPLGWLSPITVVAKILMQDLWILKCDWDAQLPDSVRAQWQEYCFSLKNLSCLSIARWLGSSNNQSYQIHGFSDASTRAYAAAVYLRCEDDAGGIQISLIAAKTRVAPVKTVSVPNLELCGADLLVKLIFNLKKLEFIKNLPIYAWTDSQIVLTWLAKHPCHWKTFVANRVSFIQTELPTAIWGHVPTKDNPADLGTRGTSVDELIKCDLWWHGPTWLARTAQEWPQSPIVAQNLHVQAEQLESEWLNRYSTLSRLIRVVAYCRRPIINLRLRKANRPAYTSFLTSIELSEARDTVIRLAQASAFKKELKLLRTGQMVTKSSPLSKLNPVIEGGIIRVGGRLINSQLTYSQKHPPILPYRSHLSRLFVKHAHSLSLHGGPTLTLSLLQQNVWVLGRNRLIKTVIRNCVPCQRVKPHFAHQMMGDLPAARVTAGRPFSSTGLDYAGPIAIRTTKGRGHRSYKGYIALFICFATRAIHLELVSDLTTSSFISAYRRFVGRRGICQRLYSDNATTFHGADKELRNMFQAASTFYKETAAQLANDGTEWTFIPPNTPHYGGLWEAGVKSTKHHLKRVIGEHTLTFEELSTLLVEIEACLNSRPLCPMKADVDDLEALTPSHFLIGTTSSLIPDADDSAVPINQLNRFQLLQRIRQQFWRRWSSEYLQYLQERSKWKTPTENFSVGQLVLLRDDRYPPSKWPLGRVIEVHPGPDGLVRVVTVKTTSTILRRHIARVCPLLTLDENVS